MVSLLDVPPARAALSDAPISSITPVSTILNAHDTFIDDTTGMAGQAPEGSSDKLIFYELPEYGNGYKTKRAVTVWEPLFRQLVHSVQLLRQETSACICVLFRSRRNCESWRIRRIRTEILFLYLREGFRMYPLETIDYLLAGFSCWLFDKEQRTPHTQQTLFKPGRFSLRRSL